MAHNSSIATVSDTAHLIAWHRAAESARPDALFTDSLASQLAGERGRTIASAAPRRTELSSFWFVARTKLIDDMVMNAADRDCDTVVNIAAGLDTRPFRLNLRPDLKWVEADLQNLVTEKDRLLAGAVPRCRLSRQVVDVTDVKAFSEFLDDALQNASKALVLTEGLLMYLDSSSVKSLSAALDRPEIDSWIFDFFSPGFQKLMTRLSAGLADNAPFRFAPEDGLTYFENLGWSVAEVESMFLAAYRFRRLPRWMRMVARLPQPDPRKPGRKNWWGTVRLSPCVSR